MAGRRWLAALVLLGLVTVAGGAPVPAGTVGQAGQPDAPFPDLGLGSCAAEPPADHRDPPSDVIGWSQGFWYDEPLDVDPEGELTDRDLEAVTARTMARVEALRCLQFERDVPVRVTDRESFRAEQANRSVSPDARLFANARARGLLLVNGSTDAVELERANRANAVLGYYSISDDEIVLVSDTAGRVRVDESSLAHELVHALQAQHFGFEGWGRNTTDARRAELGLVEGDATFVQRAFDHHCRAGAWAGACLERPDRPFDPAHVGLYLIAFQPYSDGPTFVKSAYDAGGWAAVDDRYGAFPASAKEVMYPRRHRDFAPDPPPLADRSSARWHPVERPGGPPWDRLGEPVLFSAFVYPALAGSGEVVPRESLFNRAPGGGLDRLDPYNYSHAVTDGWVGDRFRVYTTAGDAHEGAPVAYTMAVAFEDGAAADRFRAAYGELLALHGAEPVEGVSVPGSGRVVTIPDDEDFAGAYWIRRRGTTVRLVHAPTVGELDAVDGGVALDVEDSSTEGLAGRPAVLVAALAGLILLVLLRRRLR